MKWAFTAVLASFLGMGHAHADVHQFTFGPTPNLPGQGDCATFTAWDDVPDAYPYDMGALCFSDYPYQAGVDLPWQLGSPNNGFLIDNAPDVFTDITWTVGTGANIGDQGVQGFSETLTGYGAGVVVSGTRLVEVVRGYHICPRYRPCYDQHILGVAGGVGTVSQ